MVKPVLSRTLVVAASLAIACATALAQAAPAPRVCGTYSAWPDGGYQFRTELNDLFKGLGWSYTCVENTHVADLVADLDRFDIFCPVDVYNYTNPQVFEQYTEQWMRFLKRGGIIIGLDANYGQQLTWLTKLGEGLALGPRQCDIGNSDGTNRKVTIAAPDDPFAPLPEMQLPWAHFDSRGPGWKVLGKCDDGHAICLRADIDKGVLIASNYHIDRGFPSAQYLTKAWASQWPRVMDARLKVDLNAGSRGVGVNSLAVRADADALPADATVVCETRRQGEDWEQQQTPLAAGAASLQYRAGAGPTEVRVALKSAGQPVWWSSFTCANADLPAMAVRLQAALDAASGDLASQPQDSGLRQWHAALTAQLRQAEATTNEALPAQAGPDNQKCWDRVQAALNSAQTDVAILAGRAAAVAALVRETPGGAGRPFAIVRSEPLAKLHRDEKPTGTWSGPVRLQAARSEGESVQLGIVPLGRGDLEGVRVRFEPLRGPSGAVIGPSAVELHRVGYVHVQAPSSGAPADHSWWPDPLLPADRPFKVDHVCQPVWLDVSVPRDAAPGAYAGAIAVEAAGRTERVPVELTVYDFALPVAHSLRQVFVFRSYLVAQKYLGGDGDAYLKTVPLDKVLQMMDVCLKRRLGVQVFGNEGASHPCAAMPYLREEKTPQGWKFDFTETDRVLVHQRQAGMRTLYVGFSALGQFTSGREREAEYMQFLEAYLKALQPHLEQKGWLDDAVFYMVDEAWGKDAVDANVKIAALMDRVAPKIKRLMTAPRDPSLLGRAQIWVPGGMPDAHPKDADAQARIAGWRTHNAEMWWYICCGPTHPYPNFFVDYPTIDNRMVFWLTWKYNKTGFLYWGVEYHGDPKDMTPDGPTEHYELGPASMGNGDGTLCYWGPDMTLYPSVRLDAIRDGIEDYEYFAMLKRLADKAEAAHKAPDLVSQARNLLAVDDRVLRITDGSPNFAYPTDSTNLLSARRQLADLISRLSKQVKDDGPR